MANAKITFVRAVCKEGTLLKVLDNLGNMRRYVCECENV